MSDTYTNTVISAAIDVLPPVIPLPQIDRPYAGTDCSPSEVKSPADLPNRLFLGDLDEQSFQSSANGWSAAYLDDDGETRVDINYDHKADRLAMSQTWRGDFGAGCIVGTNDFGHLARNSFGFPYTPGGSIQRSIPANAGRSLSRNRLSRRCLQIPGVSGASLEAS